MKRMFLYFVLFMLIGSVPLTMALGQEKKSEQKKIKVVIDDGSGTKTVLDTTFTGGTLPKTVTLKDGKVIFIGEPGTGMADFEPDAGTKNVFITVTSDDNSDKKEEKKIIIMSSDSVNWTAKSPEKGKNVYVYSTTKSTGGKPGTRVVVTSAGVGEDIWEEEGGDSDEGVKKEVVKEETKKTVKK